MIDLGLRSHVPQESMRWPNLPNAWTQIQQIKAAAQPTRLANQSQSQVSSINMPKPVTPVSILVRSVGGLRQVTVHFLGNSADTNYQKTNIHFRSAGGQPVLIASGVESPFTFTLPPSRASAVLILQTEGSWGPNPVQNSPSRAFNLK